MTRGDGTAPVLSPSRRSVVRGAAWSTPIVAAVAAAPAYAASPCASCPDISFGNGTPTGTTAGLTNATGRLTTTGGVTWTLSSTATGYTSGSSTNNFGFVAPTTTGGFANKGVFFESSADPTSSRTVSVTSTTVTRASNQCNQIRMGILDYTSAGPDPVMAVSYGGIACVGTYTGPAANGTSGGNVDRGIQTWAIPVAAPLAGVIRITFTYSAGSQNYDDVGLYQPSIACA